MHLILFLYSHETDNWEPLFHLAGLDWKNCPSILSLMGDALSKVQTKKDPNGVFILEDNSVLLKMFEFALCLEKTNAYKEKIVQDYFDTVLRSHQARVVVFQWLKLREHKLRYHSTDFFNSLTLKGVRLKSNNAIRVYKSY